MNYLDTSKKTIHTENYSEDIFKKILEATPDAILMINEKGRIIFVNEQTEKLFGYKKSELVDGRVEKLIPEPYRHRHPDHRANYFKEPRSRPMGSGMELFGLRKNKEIFPVEISLSPLETTEGIISLAAIRDMTDRKQIEETLKEKNIELKNAIMAKDRFLANMSHELRTPLNAIIGFTGTLLMKLPGPLNAEQEKQLTTVKRSARHLLSLINDLLDLAKIDSGKLELNVEEINCQALIMEVYSTLLPFANSKQLHLTLDLPRQPVLIDTDKRALMQIVLNIVNNAIKFTDKGEVAIKLDQRQQSTFIEVRDTGIGIRRSDQKKLFHAFQQICQPGEKIEGTGLGLHVSQKLAVLIRGHIDLKSTYRKGSVFTIDIPAKDEL